jgi:hypothetical protein
MNGAKRRLNHLVRPGYNGGGFMFSRSMTIGAIAIMLIFAVGCSKPYTILQPLEEPIDRPATVQIGNLSDQLPLDTPDDKKPNLEDISKLRDVLQKYLLKSDVFVGADSGSTAPAYEVRGSILGFKRGSGFLRFMFGFGIGSAQLVTHLELVKKSDNRIVFSGDFQGIVVGGFQSGAAMYDRVAKDFSKEIKKQCKDTLSARSSSGN